MVENEESGSDRTDAAQREESQAMGVGGVMTPAQSRGALRMGLLGFALGVPLGALVGLIPFADIGFGPRVLICAAMAGVFSSLVGALFGGFFKPDAEGETGTLPGEPKRDIAKRRSGKAE